VSRRRRNQKLSPAQASLGRMVGPLEGGRIPRGCDRCDAYQVVEPVMAGVWGVNVYHDDWCPFVAEHERRAER
jgi:hypothetical protein